MAFIIKTKVLTSEGDSIKSGTYVDYTAYTNTVQQNMQVPFDLKFWRSQDLYDQKFDKFIPLTNPSTKDIPDPKDNKKTIKADVPSVKVINFYKKLQESDFPLSQVQFDGWVKEYLESVWGSGNVQPAQ